MNTEQSTNQRPSTMSRQSRGFTLIELMIVVAIIGILASLAVAAYQTYTVRAQISEGLTFAGGAKGPIVESFNNSGVPPADLTAAGMPPNPADIRGAYVSRLNVSNGRIDVTFGNRVHQDVFGDTLSLTPYQAAGGSIIWRCGYSPAPAGTALLTGGGVTTAYQVSTVEERYLPSTCRQ
jgi:type IV pilus assembly protein PilA